VRSANGQMGKAFLNRWIKDAAANPWACRRQPCRNFTQSGLLAALHQEN
jgi:hypothetical protein